MKEFLLVYSSSKGYQIGELTFELKESQTKKPADVTDIEYEQKPKEVFEITTESIEENVVKAKAKLLDEFLGSEDFRKDIRQPFTIKAKLKPKKAATKKAKQVLETFQIKVPPNATLRWETKQPEYQAGRGIQFPEFQGPEWLTLRVWIEEWDTKKKKAVESSTKFDFTHYLLPKTLPVESLPYFGPRRKGPYDIKKRGPHELTEWGRKEAFNEDNKPDALAEAIRVRAWEPGSITTRGDPPGFGPNPQRIELANPDGKEGVKIPLNVKQRKLKAEVTRITQADGTEGGPVRANEANSTQGVKITINFQSFMEDEES